MFANVRYVYIAYQMTEFLLVHLVLTEENVSAVEQENNEMELSQNQILIK
jgi:hypothetical protein